MKDYYSVDVYRQWCRLEVFSTRYISRSVCGHIGSLVYCAVARLTRGLAMPKPLPTKSQPLNFTIVYIYRNNCVQFAALFSLEGVIVYLVLHMSV